MNEHAHRVQKTTSIYKKIQPYLQTIMDVWIRYSKIWNLQS